MVSFKHFFNPYIKVKNSKIHGKGVYARKDITKGTRIIEYLGIKISKEDSEKIYEKQLELHKKNPSKTGSVYIFDVDEHHDLDGDVWWNRAKLVNHSCSPNCEALTEDDGTIALYSMKNIKKGDELFFNYGYTVDTYEDHPCRCGSKNCVGHIVAKDQWSKLKKLLKEKQEKQHEFEKKH